MADYTGLVNTLRGRIDPEYAQTRGTDSYERRQAVEAIEAQAAELETLRKYVEDLLALNAKLSDILSRTALEIRRPEPALYGWDDLPDRAVALRKIADLAAAARFGSVEMDYGQACRASEALGRALEEAGMITGHALPSQD